MRIITARLMMKVSQLVVFILKGGALEFHLRDINPQMPYQMVIDKVRKRYNTPHRMLSLQQKVDSLNTPMNLWLFIIYMTRKNVYDT